MAELEDLLRADLQRLALVSDPPPDLTNRILSTTVGSSSASSTHRGRRWTWIAPAAAAAAVVGIAAVVVTLAGPHGQHRPPANQGPTTHNAPISTAQPSTGTVSFCVGTNSLFHAGDVVVVHITRNGADLAAPSITVPMRVSAQVTVGPVLVVVANVQQLAGVVHSGETLSGALGAGCPPG